MKAPMLDQIREETEDTEVILGLSPKCKPGQHLLSYRRFTQMTQFNLYLSSAIPNL